MAQFIASSQIVGKTCPYCQSPIKPGIPIEVCDSCHIPHHTECWASNGGCTTFGCAGAGAPRPLAQAPVPDPYSAPPPGSYAAPPVQPPYAGYNAQPPYPPSQTGWPPNTGYPPQQPGWPPQPYGVPVYSNGNDSGAGAMAILPRELQGFNWGAFLNPFWWSIFNRTYVGLLCLIPYVGWAMVFVLGFKGNEWAWQNRRFFSIDEFRVVQRAWTNWGVALLVVGIVIGVCIGVIEGMNGS